MFGVSDFGFMALMVLSLGCQVLILRFELWGMSGSGLRVLGFRLEASIRVQGLGYKGLRGVLGFRG